MENISTTTPTAAPSKPVEGPKGIGGWLILPLLHLIATVILTGVNLGMALQYWEGLLALATGTADPSVQWMAFPTIASLVLGAVIIAMAIYALVQLFQKKRAVPRLMIWFYGLVLVVTLFESGIVFAFQEFQETSADVTQAVKDLVRAFLGVVIWVPYFLVSKRVKATFIE